MLSFHILILTLGASVVPLVDAGLFYDLSGGSAGLLSPCTMHSLTGVFVEERASLYEPDTDGLVLVSKYTDDLGCLQTPEFVQVHRNFTFRVRAFLPRPVEVLNPVPIFYAYLWNEQEGLIPLAYHMGPTTDGWVEWQQQVPHYLQYPQMFKVEIRSDLYTASYVAIRWFGLSDEQLPPLI
ncbi:Hypothetical predicted protein [Cloeon dipterum]|uniref:Uncharacterized protein n=1 Tax=Cloeon dipterum TaxID=197152 RepID=A0A8S1C6K8_9INSE|nr:Hypothetical predicted protein [Cloeon dipterum]